MKREVILQDAEAGLAHAHQIEGQKEAEISDMRKAIDTHMYASLHLNALSHLLVLIPFLIIQLERNLRWDAGADMSIAGSRTVQAHHLLSSHLVSVHMPKDSKAKIIRSLSSLH